MKSLARIAMCLVTGIGFSSLTGGCAAFRASTADLDVSQKKHFDANFDYSDLRQITQSVAEDFIGSEFAGEGDERPIVMIAGVQNRTSEYVDTKNLTDRIRTILFKSGKVRFINASRREDLLKEQGYQAAHATPESQAAIGRQLGASYMMSGSMTEMQQRSPKQVRVSKQEVKYYKLTMELTSLESGELLWTSEKEFARQVSKPLIGW